MESVSVVIAHPITSIFVYFVVKLPLQILNFPDSDSDAVMIKLIRLCTYSTETAFLKVVNDLFLSLSKGNISVLALLDFSSAFVCHY